MLSGRSSHAAETIVRYISFLTWQLLTHAYFPDDRFVSIQTIVLSV